MHNINDIRVKQLWSSIKDKATRHAAAAGAGGAPPTFRAPFLVSAELEDFMWQTDREEEASGVVSRSVSVASSSIAADLIGQNGCTIVALQVITNTCITSPRHRDKPLLFHVTGSRVWDVHVACFELRRAAEHSTIVRQARRVEASSRYFLSRSLSVSSSSSSNSVLFHSAPTSLDFAVSKCLVGLVIGARGATIKGIQERSKTLIVSPDRSSDTRLAVFTILGSSEAVQKAKCEIVTHVLTRTGLMLNEAVGISGSSNNNDQSFPSGDDDERSRSAASDVFRWSSDADADGKIPWTVQVSSSSQVQATTCVP